MPEEVKKDEVKKEEPKKKNALEKLKEKAGDSEEHLAILSTFVRLGILVWSGGILTLNYVTIPGFPQGKIDPTFIASVFTGVLATFGVQTAKSKNGNGGSAPSGGVSKSDLEKLINAALKLRLLKRLGLSKHHSKSAETHQHLKDHQNQTTPTKCNVMNIKWATLTVGALFGFAHIGILGHILTKPQYPEIKFPDGDYSSFTVKSGKDGYQIEYKANDPAILESSKSLSHDKDKRGLFGPTTEIRREYRSDQYTMDGQRNIGGATTQTLRERTLQKAKSVFGRTLAHEVKVRWQELVLLLV